MALLTENCPRCGTKHVTFDVTAQKSKGKVHPGWVERFEIFAVCRHCHQSTIFVVDNNIYDFSDRWTDPDGAIKYQGYLNDSFDVKGYIATKDQNVEPAPEHLPEAIKAVFDEGATCLSVQCWNAAGAMFRLAIDLATKSLLPAAGEEPNAKIRRSLGLRLEWMFDNSRLSPELRDLADCIKEDGNDGAHDGTLTKNEALDLRDFTFTLLERVYTVPKRIELAAERRNQRRGP